MRYTQLQFLAVSVLVRVPLRLRAVRGLGTISFEDCTSLAWATLYAVPRRKLAKLRNVKLFLVKLRNTVTNSYDCLVVGGGITGAALSYELAKQGLHILLLEQNSTPNNATEYSYGGLPSWSGTSPLTRQICQEGMELHHQLSEELEADTEFRELDLLLTIPRDQDPQFWKHKYAHFAISPQLLDRQQACQLEPLLNGEAIAGALHLPHGHIHPGKTTQAYLQGYQRLGGEIKFVQVQSLLQSGNVVKGVATNHGNYYAAQTVVCAGGLSRALLKKAGINVCIYFTHAELIKTPPVDIKLQALIMPANLQRFALEAEASKAQMESRWDQPDNELVSPILDPGAVQFADGSLRLGQWSRILSDPYGNIDASVSERAIRQGVGTILPSLGNLPGTWHHCLVAFSSSSLPMVGAIPDSVGVYLFSGFTSTLLFAPPLARHFARWFVQGSDELIKQLPTVV